MILYLDSSSLAKRYVQEAGSQQVAQAIEEATLVGTAAISRVEVAAALGKMTNPTEFGNCQRSSASPTATV